MVNSRQLRFAAAATAAALLAAACGTNAATNPEPPVAQSPTPAPVAPPAQEAPAPIADPIPPVAQPETAAAAADGGPIAVTASISPSEILENSDAMLVLAAARALPQSTAFHISYAQGADGEGGPLSGASEIMLPAGEISVAVSISARELNNSISGGMDAAISISSTSKDVEIANPRLAARVLNSVTVSLGVPALNYDNNALQIDLTAHLSGGTVQEDTIVELEVPEHIFGTGSARIIIPAGASSGQVSLMAAEVADGEQIPIAVSRILDANAALVLDNSENSRIIEVEMPAQEPPPPPPPPPQQPDPVVVPDPGPRTVIVPPVLRNNPPAPIHAGGEPYPLGTFPPHVAPLWEQGVAHLRQSSTRLDGPLHCAGDYYRVYHGYVRNQWVLEYESALADPLAAISAELRAADVVFESITVRTKEYYDERYGSSTFINWLDPEHNRSFEPLAALESLGADVRPNASPDSYSKLTGPRRKGHFYYQVKVHGLSHGDPAGLSNAMEIFLSSSGGGCTPSYSHLLSRFYAIAGGLYTTFGNDVVLSEFLKEPAAILTNSPEAPIHTGGEPYPPGTFPPQHRQLWDDLVRVLRSEGTTVWNGRLEGHDYLDELLNSRLPSYGSCATKSTIGYVKHQILYGSDAPLENPAEHIAAELRSHGIQFESVTVRTASDYAMYETNTFFNWLATEDTNNDPYAALRKLGAQLHPSLRVGRQILIPEHPGAWPSAQSQDEAEGSQKRVRDYKHLYQVILHGHDRDVQTYAQLPGIDYFRLDGVPGECSRYINSSQTLMRLMLLGLYTTFGNDVVLGTDAHNYTRHPLLEMRSAATFSGRIELQYLSATFLETDTANVREFLGIVENDETLRNTIAEQVRRDLETVAVNNRITRIEIPDQWRPPVSYGLPSETMTAQQLSLVVSIEGRFPENLPQWESYATSKFINIQAAAEAAKRRELGEPARDIPYNPYLVTPEHPIGLQALYEYDDQEFRFRGIENTVEFIQDSYGWDIPGITTMNPEMPSTEMSATDTNTMNPRTGGSPPPAR